MPNIRELNEIFGKSAKDLQPVSTPKVPMNNTKSADQQQKAIEILYRASKGESVKLERYGDGQLLLKSATMGEVRLFTQQPTPAQAFVDTSQQQRVQQLQNNVGTLERERDQLRGQVKQFDDAIKNLKEAPALFATVIKSDEKRTIINSLGKEVEVNTPDPKVMNGQVTAPVESEDSSSDDDDDVELQTKAKVAADGKDPFSDDDELQTKAKVAADGKDPFPTKEEKQVIRALKIGCRVRITPETMQIISVVEDGDVVGEILDVKDVPKPGMAEIERAGASRAIAFGKDMNVEEGDRVVVDQTGTVVTANLGKPKNDLVVTQATGICWDDIGGCVEAKRQMREAIEGSVRHASLYKRFGKKPTRGILLHGAPGCIAGDMHVPYSVRDVNGRRQNTKGGTMENLYRRFNKLPRDGKGSYQRPETVGSRFFVPSMEENGKVFHHEIGDVVYSGFKECVRVRTVGGLELVCTPDHPIATSEGFTHAEELKVGDRVMVHRNVPWTSEAAEKHQAHRPEIMVKHHPYAHTKIVKTSSGDYEYRRLTRARVVFEANLNGLDQASYVARLNDGNLEGLKFVPPGYDIHHIDENYLNDVSTNLVAISHAEHAKKHMVDLIDGRPRLAHIAVEDEIASIEKAGEQPTYDIKMKSNPHNFVAEGFVVHNCGKTLLGKAAATALAELHGAAGKGAFFYVKGPELLNMYVGNSEANIRKMFDNARRHFKRYGFPAIIFLDEADAILGSRTNSRGLSSLSSTTVPQFLSEMDGLDETGAMVIVATNRPTSLDAAVVRDGRLDRRVKVGRPEQGDAHAIFRIHLGKVEIAQEKDVGDFLTKQPDGTTLSEALIDLATRELYASKRVLFKIGRKSKGTLTDKLLLSHTVNGAMIAGVVDRAVSRAMRRTISGSGPDGVMPDDMVTAVDEVFNEALDVNHDEEIMEFAGDWFADVSSVSKADPVPVSP